MRTLPHLKHTLRILAVSALLSARVFADTPAKPVLYNHLEGDGGVELDKAIKAAYGDKFNIVDIRLSDGFEEPEATAGKMPDPIRNEFGQLVGGYVLATYLVTPEGLVADPVIVSATDPHLAEAALEAMADWRFKPGTLRGAAVATTAAQEFTFGPTTASTGYRMDRVGTYQGHDVLLARMPEREVVFAYVDRIKDVTHKFFVGAKVPEVFHIVVVVRPDGWARFWFVSSKPGANAADLEPLRRLLEAIPTMKVKGGPVILAVSGRIAGGDGSESLEKNAYESPVPREWRDLAKAKNIPLAFSTDEFQNLVWDESK